MPMTPRILVDLALAASLAGIRSIPLLIVTYHRVPEVPDAMLPSEPHAAAFRLQMEFVARHLRPLPLPEAVDRLYAGTLPKRAICITFDDGYANNHDVALPVLRSVGVPATFFIATGYLDGGIMFNDEIIEAMRRSPRTTLDLSPLGFRVFDLAGVDARRRAAREINTALKYRSVLERGSLVTQIRHFAEADVPASLMMTTHQVRALQAAGMDVGGHTSTHPILARLPDEEASREISAGRTRLGEILGAPPRSFAYPNGRPGDDFEVRHAEMVKAAGYSYALSTVTGGARESSDRWQIPRITLWSRTVPRLTANLMSHYARAR